MDPPQTTHASSCLCSSSPSPASFAPFWPWLSVPLRIHIIPPLTTPCQLLKFALCAFAFNLPTNMSNHRYNSWLKTKKKGELENLAESVGLSEYVHFTPDLLIYVPFTRAPPVLQYCPHRLALFLFCAQACPSAFATRPLYHHDPSMRSRKHSCADTNMQYRRLQERRPWCGS